MPRCKNCKEKFIAVNFNQKYCFTPACVGVWCKTIQDKKWKDKVKAFKIIDNEKRLPQLAKTQFHTYIRLRDKDKGCISCGNPFKAKYDAGHYWNSNNHSIIRYSEDNVHGQCVRCNRDLHGNLLEYQIKLKQKIGLDKYNLLHNIRHTHKQWTAEELKDIITIYKAKVKSFQQSLQE